MSRLAGLYRLPLASNALLEIVNGPAFTRHSKTGDRFAAGDRAREQKTIIDAHSDEIEKVAYWAEKVAESAGISLTLPASLIEGDL
jgi:hypothetical protein